MKFSQLKITFAALTVFAFCLSTVSCGSKDKDGTTGGEEIQEPDPDTAKTTIMNFCGQIFSIPSPVETSLLIQKSGAAFSTEVINPHSSDDYKDNFTQALNLGVYGADLGYVAMYEQSAEQIRYLNQARKLSDALGIADAFNPQTMKRINDNITSNKKDSLLVLVGVVYRASDAFLKNNSRCQMSSLILVGGWLESINYAAQINKTKSNTDLKNRIAYQKQSLAGIIKLLEPFKENDCVALREKLIDLGSSYEGIKFNYVYEKPETDALNKVTTINSHTDVVITNEQLKQITDKVKSLRDWVINPQKP
jgi:hypothetical protein